MWDESDCGKVLGFLGKGDMVGGNTVLRGNEGGLPSGAVTGDNPTWETFLSWTLLLGALTTGTGMTGYSPVGRLSWFGVVTDGITLGP